MQNKYGKVKRLLLLFILLSFVGLGAACFMYFSSTNPSENVLMEIFQMRVEMAPGVSIDGIDVSSMTQEEASALLSQQKPPRLGTVTIANGDIQKALDLSGLEPVMDTEAVIAQAIAFGNEGEKEQREAERYEAEVQGKAFVSTPKYDLTPLREQVVQIAAELAVEPVDAKVAVVNRQDVASESGEDSTTQTTTSPEPTPLLSDESDGEAVAANAAMSGEIEGLEGYFEYIEGIAGSSVDADALFEAVQAAIDTNAVDEVLQAPATAIEPAKTLDDVKQSFQLISEATSSFAKGTYSAPNRVYNISKAAGIINGYLLEPGEVFSFNDVLGPRKSSTGWKAAGAINDGQSVEEVGGGICQVSSTAFNAVLMADFEVVERNPHSWPLSYLPAGQDATISTGGPDFKFKNNRTTPVVLVAKVDTKGKTFTVQFYGEPVADGMEIKLVSNKIATISQPATEVQKVSTPGVNKVIRKGRAGSKYETYKEYYKDGVLLKTEFAYSTRYRAFSTVIQKGPEVASAAVPSSSGADESSSGSGDDVVIPIE